MTLCRPPAVGRYLSPSPRDILTPPFGVFAPLVAVHLNDPYRNDQLFVFLAGILHYFTYLCVAGLE